jgi:hypothetical protein
LLVLFATLAITCMAGTLPELSVSLAETNTGTGLTVPSAGDGAAVAEIVSGSTARRTTSHYLYVIVNHPSWTSGGPVDAYVVVEAFDDAVAGITVQSGSKYTTVEDTMFLAGSGKWRRGVFRLPGFQASHKQNFGAEFRICGRNLAVRRITVSTQPPAGYDPDHPIDAEALRSLAVERVPGMELTLGNDADATTAPLFKALSVTSVESYVDWAGVEPEPGKWDWSKWDKQVAILQRAGLKWVPFLIAGPAYATPLWFQNSADSHVYRCLEHGKDSKVQTLFNPQLRPQIERFLQAFADRYRDSGVIESVLLGITGIYGESIYPAGPEGGWTAKRTGDYHNHHGWWAGDALAVAAFRKAMRERYDSIAELNAAWGTTYASFDNVTTFLPDRAPNDRAHADFVEWYQQAMTDWAVFWVGATRKAFRKTEIYLCTGGEGSPFLGADFTAQTAAIARFRAGVRITNEGSDYAQNFTITREVATATRHYGTFCGFEPASHVDSNGVVARIYNATASGAHQLHDYKPNLLSHADASMKNFRANAPLLVPRRPQVDAALYLSRETWALDQDAVHRTLALAAKLRDVSDLGFVTRRSAMDGHLRQYRVLVLAESSVLEPKAAAAIERWVRAGGTLIVAGRVGERLHDNAAWRARLLRETSAKPVLDGEPPSHWQLNVGSANDEPWLTGQWHGPERTMRWSGARAGVLLPVKADTDYRLRLSLSVPKAAGAVTVCLNGKTLGVISNSCEFAVRSAESPARLKFTTTAWTPGNHDKRWLGFSLRQVELIRAGAENEPATLATLRFVAENARVVGRGRTIFLPGCGADSRALLMVFAAALPEPVDGRLDGRFATVTDCGVLWFDRDASRIWQVEP